MKKLLYVIVVLAFFLFGLSFVLQNPGSVTLNYYREWSMEIPLAMLLFVTVICGILIGYFASVLKSLKLRAQLAKANRQIKALSSEDLTV